MDDSSRLAQADARDDLVQSEGAGGRIRGNCNLTIVSVKSIQKQQINGQLIAMP